MPRCRPDPPDLSHSSPAPSLAVSHLTEHARRRQRAPSWPPATPSLADALKGSASTPSFLPTDPRPSGSPATPPPSLFRRRPPKLTAVDSPPPTPPRAPRGHRCNPCEPLFLFPLPSSSRSSPSLFLHRGREFLAAGHGVAVATATAARSRAHPRAHRNLRNPKHLTIRPPVHRSAGPANPRAPAAASGSTPANPGHPRTSRWSP